MKNCHITLRRYYNENLKSVIGNLEIIGNGIKVKILTLENKKYLLESGTYVLKWEYSPKFNKYLWEFYGTEGRTEIKFHHGRIREHSKGCPLISNDGLNSLNNILDTTEDHTIIVY